MQTKLTDRVVHNAKAGEYWDQHESGFGLRVSEGGSRTYFLMYRVNGTRRRLRIGDAKLMGLAAARTAARAAKAKVDQNIDPKEKVVVVKKETVREAFATYVRQHVEVKLRERSQREFPATFAKHVLPAIGDFPIDQVTRSHVHAIIDHLIVDLKMGAGANRVLAGLSAFFNWALDRELIAASPANIKKKVDEESRDRVLDDDEITAFWEACEGAFGRMCQLLLVTGQRRDEVRMMRWREVDLDKRVWSLPGSRTKNKKPHDVHLTDLAIGLLGEQGEPDELVFKSRFGSELSGLSYGKSKLDAEMTKVLGNLKEWRLHDLRRTCATMMAETLSVDPHVIEKVLNHTSGTIRGVAAVYNRATYSKQTRDAWVRWSQEIERITGSNVTQLRA